MVKNIELNLWSFYVLYFIKKRVYLHLNNRYIKIPVKYMTTFAKALDKSPGQVLDDLFQLEDN